MTLAQAKPGGSYRVLAVRGEDLLADRLLAAGLWPGAVVAGLWHAPWGDPQLFRLHAYRLALRRAEAERVTVEPCPADAGGGR